MLTEHGREFCGTKMYPYELLLSPAEVKHRRSKVRRSQTNGFVERFHRTVSGECFRVQLRTTFYESRNAFLTNPDAWLHYYNTECPHQDTATWAVARRTL